jgi:hypothetical protein
MEVAPTPGAILCLIMEDMTFNWKGMAGADGNQILEVLSSRRGSYGSHL